MPERSVSPSVSERLRALAWEIENGPTYDPTRRDHTSTVKVMRALASEIEEIAEEIRAIQQGAGNGRPPLSEEGGSTVTAEGRDPLEALQSIVEYNFEHPISLVITDAIAAWEKERADRGPTDFKYETIRAALERIEGEMRRANFYGLALTPSQMELVNQWADELRALREGTK